MAMAWLTFIPRPRETDICPGVSRLPLSWELVPVVPSPAGLARDPRSPGVLPVVHRSLGELPVVHRSLGELPVLQRSPSAGSGLVTSSRRDSNTSMADWAGLVLLRQL